MHKNTEIPFHARHEDELLTLDEVAEILRASPNTVRWWRQMGTGPDFFKIGRRPGSGSRTMRRHGRAPARSAGKSDSASTRSR